LIRTVAETRSTNEDMVAMAGEGAAEGSWLRAEQQSGGRGRMGRVWSSPPGNLYASTIVRILPGDPAAASLGFVAAVALAEVLSSLAPHILFEIKWPNDVLASGAKLSGILLERSGDAVIIGIGVNLASHPDLPDRKTISLAKLTDQSVEPQSFIEELAACFARWLVRWRGEGLGTVIAAWEKQAHPIGTALSVNLPDGEALSGSYQGLDADGALRLRLANGTVRGIHAGDVFLV
jgi:BirA family transcriptional regulator, biotin operon repressor / biotin---[acetyl-CoA-carboxylase] ligase